ncbi:MAG: SDR family NAD(P)-dependent oxidoreductase, partial [Rhodobacteraceae bacterium]|nr:SDR family NAD(P)-dependent oxidoreductase [Paracoccaceae bacterium]
MTQRVLITAGASGVGRAMAEVFAATGARVWVADLDRDALSACPTDWKTSEVDVSDETGVEAMFAQISSD